MTPTFAEEYRQTAADVEDAIVAGQDRGAGERGRAGRGAGRPDQVQALVFLKQYVGTTKNGRKEPVYTPYRVLVTVVNTDQGWLVSDLETK